MRTRRIHGVVIGSIACLAACQAEAPPAVVAVPPVASPPIEAEAEAPTCPRGRHLQDKECVIDYAWLPRKAGDMIPNAVNANEERGTSMVCRAHHGNGVHPGHLEPSGCSIGWGGREFIEPEFEALIGPQKTRWRKARLGSVPPGALPGGGENGYDLSICRAIVDGRVISGKVVGNCCSVGYRGAEVGVIDYEVLVEDPTRGRRGEPPDDR